MENTFSGTTKGRDTRMMFKPKSKGAVLPRRAPERQDGFMRKKKMLKQTKRTAATHPRKRNSEYSMSLEERRARKLRLTRYVTIHINHSSHGFPFGVQPWMREGF